MNEVVLVGRTTKAVVVPEGQDFTVARIAVNYATPDRKHQEVAYVEVLAFGKLGKALATHSGEKGKAIAVVGRISTSEYTDKKGLRQYQVKVIARSIDFLEYKDTRIALSSSNINNQVNLIGRWTKDIEIRKTESGKHVATPILAVNGIKEDDTSFLPVVLWGGYADAVAKHNSKGSRVMVRARLVNADYTDADGNKRYVTKLLASDVTFLDPKKKPSEKQEKAVKHTESDTSEVNITPEDLPF